MSTAFFPLLIDCHVHFREPGLEHKADMETEATAAFHGGIGMVCEMPNTNPPTQTIAALRDKITRAERARQLCDLRFFFGATTTEHLQELELLWTDAGLVELKKRCSGLKLYLDNSTGNMKADESVVADAFALCGKLDIPLVAHCEHSHINDTAANEHPALTVADHSNRRPANSEVESIRGAIALAEKFNTPLHVAHLSTAGGLELVKEAKLKGLRVTCEVTPHHLFLTTADYPELSSRIKVNPPIRNDEQEALWVGLLDGSIDCIATDHAPHLMTEKALGANAPSGMPGVEVVLPLMLSIIARHWPHPTAPAPEAAFGAAAPHLQFTDLFRMMFTNPNRIFRLEADPTIRIEVSTAGESVLEDAQMHSKCGWTPYHGWKLRGSWRRIE